MSSTTADVVVFASIPMVLTYAVPEGMLLQHGCRVVVPVRNSKRVGMAVGSGMQDTSRLKTIDALLDQSPLIPEKVIELLLWTARYYHVPPGLAIALAFPPYLRHAKSLDPPAEYRVLRAPGSGRLGPRQKEILNLIPEAGLDLNELKRLSGGAGAAIQGLRQKGYVILAEKKPEFRTSCPPEFSVAQQHAIARISATIRAAEYRAFVLHGVTGSGKTEIYLACALETLKRGRSVIYMVPEIALTPQSIARIKERIPFETAIFHSGLSDRQRADEFLKATSGRAPFVLGTRSAIFAPVRDLGLIIVDEEHDPSYKQSEGVPYNARDLGLLRARAENAAVILGSATPSLETHKNACERADIELITLTSRVSGSPLPPAEVIDMRGRDGLLAVELLQALGTTIAKGQQALLYINRRGFSGAMACPGCGEVLKCSNCDRSLTYHKGRGLALCHYCGFRRALPEICPRCGCVEMQPVGMGTERIIAEIARHLPTARVLRMDTDEITSPARLEKALTVIRERKTDIIVGTQMIAKGHDFPGLNLVGVIQAEQMLYLPDFRAAERTFQQIVQVAGRAGRHLNETRIIIQSLMPDHPVIAAIANYDYRAFIQAERNMRIATASPPHSHMARIVFAALESGPAEDCARRAATQGRTDGVTILGPAPAPIARLRGAYRWHIIMTASDRAKLHSAVGKIEKARLSAQVKMRIDIDPYDMF